MSKDDPWIDEALTLKASDYDLRRLSEGELHLLERILAKAGGLNNDPIVLEIIDLEMERLQ